jgi:hypothetical protein
VRYSFWYRSPRNGVNKSKKLNQRRGATLGTHPIVLIVNLESLFRVLEKMSLFPCQLVTAVI